MRTKHLERNALLLTMDYLRTQPHATARELWINLYRADILVPLNTYKRWLREWAQHTDYTNITKTQRTRNRYQYTLATAETAEPPTFVRLMNQVDQYLQAR